MNQKVLLIGSNGQLGRCILDRVPEHWDIISTTSAELNLARIDDVKKFILKIGPDIIINAAAYTAVDKAETEEELAFKVNSTAPILMAQIAYDLGAKFIHVSTDYVFSGDSTTPYSESDKTSPKSVYGASKLKGEIGIKEVNPDATIIRTAWVFSEYGKNFVKTMISLSESRKQISVVDDQRGCPTYAGDLAEAIKYIISKELPGGIYHYCGNKDVTWRGFADVIFSIMNNYLAEPRLIEVEGISTEYYPTPAQRPKYSVLSCNKIESFGMPTSDWNKALIDVMEKLLTRSR